MAKKLKSISANYDLAYYTDENNIRNQDLVKETIEYFETGEGARAFNPLEFLNLLEKQNKFVVENIKETNTVISHLKALPLTELENHILFGFILKRFGGYPVNNLNEDFDKTLKAIQKEFLGYEGETPEKEFCKADFERRKKFMKLGIAFTTPINNNNMDVTEVYNAMDETQPKRNTYSSFYELFEDAAGNNAFGDISNRQVYLIKRSMYNFEFNVWLQDNKGWEYGNETQYQTFLNKETFLEYLKCEKEKERKRKDEVELNILSWQQVSELTTEQKIVYFKKVKHCIPFIELHHTVTTVCEFVKPIYQSIEPLKYIEYFFKNIDFDKIDNEPTKSETLRYCNAIYTGLEQHLKTDIDKEILKYQNNVSSLSKEQIEATQLKLVELIGNLKKQARTNEAGISFTKRYNSLYKSIEAKERLLSIDYQILISHFNETILNDLLSSFEIINGTFKEITPLLKALPPQQAEKKTTGLKIDQIALIHFYEGNQITRENGNNIAKQYDHRSGEKLFQRFTFYSSTANRKGKPTPCTPKRLKNKIELFESVVTHLSESTKQRTIDEINILKTIFENEYQ